MMSDFGDRAGARTRDPLIKSQMLYQLSYSVIFCPFLLRRCKYTTYFLKNKFKFIFFTFISFYPTYSDCMTV